MNARRPKSDYPLILDIEASALENGFPIEIGIAHPSQGAVHAWLIRPHASWAWDAWNPASEKIHGLSRTDLARGGDVFTVAREILRAVGGRPLATDNPQFDGFWLSKLFEAAREDAPAVEQVSLVDAVAAFAHRHGRNSADVDAINRARNSAIDHSAAGDAASWAAVIEVMVGQEEVDLSRIDEVFEKWAARAQAASPWRIAR